MFDKDMDISPRRCASMRGTSLWVLSACGGSPVDCSDWPRMTARLTSGPGSLDRLYKARPVGQIFN